MEATFGTNFLRRMLSRVTTLCSDEKALASSLESPHLEKNLEIFVTLGPFPHLTDLEVKTKDFAFLEIG